MVRLLLVSIIFDRNLDQRRIKTTSILLFLIIMLLILCLNLSAPHPYHLLIIIRTTYIMRFLGRHVNFVINTIDLIVLSLLGNADLTGPNSIEDLFAALLLLVIAFLAHHDHVGYVASLFSLIFDSIPHHHLIGLVAIRLDQGWVLSAWQLVPHWTTIWTRSCSGHHKVLILRPYGG